MMGKLGRKLWRLFVDDGRLAALTVVWLILAACLGARMPPVLFVAGLVAIFGESVMRAR